MINRKRSSAALLISLGLTGTLTGICDASAAPVSTDDWNTIAGSRISEKYSINKGDTLWGISKRLFGDPKYWPKIWEMNHSSIPDPHWIRPGNTIVFQPGTGNSLPEVAIANKDGSSPELKIIQQENEPPLTKTPRKPAHSEEWKLLPHQAWEREPLAMPVGVDAQGFDESAKVKRNITTGFELDAISTTDEISFLGQITASRSEGTYLTIGDTLYIKPEGDVPLQVGDTYAITEKPQKLKSDGRRGYSYLVKGKIKILTVKDSLFIGSLLGNRYLVNRGNYLMKLPARAQNITPTPGPSALTGNILLNRNFSSYLAAQHKLVIINRGTNDGLTTGMVFRAHQRKDPVTKKSISESNSLVNADMMLIQMSEKFSTALVLKSISPIEDDSEVVLLTDVSQLRKEKVAEKAILEAPVEPKKEDELDKLDKSNPEGLGAEEKKELQQLEHFKDQPPPSPSPSPSASPSPSPSASPSPSPSAEAAPLPSPTPEPTASTSPAPTASGLPSEPLKNEVAPALEPAPAPEAIPAPPAPPAEVPPPPAPAPPPAAPASPDQLPPEPEVEIPPA